MPKFKVSIERWDDEGEVDTLISVPVSAEQVAELVPDLLAVALGVEVEDVPAAGSGSPAKPKRTRRTKAQIAAEAAAISEGPAEVVVPPAAPAPVAAPTNETPAMDTPVRYDPFKPQG